MPFTLTTPSMTLLASTSICGFFGALTDARLFDGTMSDQKNPAPVMAVIITGYALLGHRIGHADLALNLFCYCLAYCAGAVLDEVAPEYAFRVMPTVAIRS